MLENTERAIKNGQSRETGKTKKNKTKTQHNMCLTPLYVNTNSINKSWTLLQTTGGKDEPKYS